MMGGYFMPEKHDQTAESRAGVLGQKKKIFFLLLHLQDGGNSIVLEKHNRTAGSHTGALRQKKKNFFSSSTFTRWS